MDQTRVESNEHSGLTSLFSELKTQSKITAPLIAMNFSWFAKIAITTAFLGRLGEVPLAGATLGFTFANVTGFSLLNGLCGAMEPICGQAFGAKNFKLLNKTLIMATCLLVATSIPIAFLWLSVDRILIQLGQQKDIAIVAKKYLVYLIPDLFLTSLLCPLRAYLSTQNVTVPIMLSSAVAAALHVPITLFLARAKGLVGVATAVWVTDSAVVISLVIYVAMMTRTRKEGGWLEGGFDFDRWKNLLKLCGPCCLTTCLEWWCYEILVLVTGRLRRPERAVGTLAIVLNFDYLLYAVMLSLSTCASVRVSNELGAKRPDTAYRSAYVSLSVSVLAGFVGGSTMAGAGGAWGALYSRNNGMVRSVKRTMMVMAVVEVVNFPLAVCGGIVRGTARPCLGIYANICGFYLVALPLGVVLGFKMHMGLGGLLVGFLGGVVACLVLLLVFVARIKWDDESQKAQILTSQTHQELHILHQDNSSKHSLQNIAL